MQMGGIDYTRVFSILDDAGLRTRSDVVALLKSSVGAKYYGVAGIKESEGSWVRDLFVEMWQMSGPALESFLIQPSPRVLGSRIWGTKYFDAAVEGDPVLDRRFLYSALFPAHTLLLSTPLLAWPYSGMDEVECPVNSGSTAQEVLEWGYAVIPCDFLAHAIELRPMLERGLVNLLPQRFKTLNYGENSGLTSTGWTAAASADIDVTAADPVAAGWRFGDEMPTDRSEQMQVVALPWLHGADASHVAQLVEEHRTEFDLYLSALGHFFTTHSFSESSLLEWLGEVQYRVDRLDACYRQKEKELRRKGRDVLVGLCFTAAPLLAPVHLGPLQELLAAAWGGASIKEGIGWLRDWRHRRVGDLTSEHWFAWKLRQAVRRGGNAQ